MGSVSIAMEVPVPVPLIARPVPHPSVESGGRSSNRNPKFSATSDFWKRCVAHTERRQTPRVTAH
jgi:hypothetical protein